METLAHRLHSKHQVQCAAWVAALSDLIVGGINMNRDFLSVDILEMVVVLVAALVASLLYL